MVLAELTKPSPVKREEHPIRLLPPFQSATDNISCAELRPLMSQLVTLGEAAPVVAMITPRRAMWPLQTRNGICRKTTSIVATIAPRRRSVTGKLEKWDVCFTKADADNSEYRTQASLVSRRVG